MCQLRKDLERQQLILIYVLLEIVLKNSQFFLSNKQMTHQVLTILSSPHVSPQTPPQWHPYAYVHWLQNRS